MKAPFLVCTVLAAVAGHPLRAQADGQALYEENCRSCHGVAGKPTDRARREFKLRIPTFADPAFFAHRSQDSIVAVLTHGVGDGQDMRSFKNMLSHDEMVAVARYMRTLATPTPASP